MPKKAFFRLSAKARAEIIDTAMDIYTNQAFEDISVRTLSEQLGLSVGSFYDYFQDKDELYFYMFDSIVSRLLFGGYYKNKMFMVPRPNLDEFLSDKEIRLYNTFRHAPEDMMRRYYFDRQADSTYVQYAGLELERMQREGLLREDLNVQFMTFLYTTMSFNVAVYFQRNYPGAPAEQKDELCRQMYEILQHGMLQQEIPQDQGSGPDSGKI